MFLETKKRKNNISRRYPSFHIEPEEIFLDAKIYKDSKNPLAYLENRLEKIISSKIFAAIFLFFIAGVILMGLRTFKFQVSEAGQWLAMAEKNRSRIYPIFPQRGIIYDRNLKPLVKNQTDFDLIVVPELLPSGNEERLKIKNRLAEIFSSSSDEIIQNFDSLELRSSEPKLLVSDIGTENFVKINAFLDEMPGIRIENNYQRDYVFGPALSNVLGYVGRVSKSDLSSNKDFFNTDTIGKTGLEMFYDSKLRGVDGKKRFNVDSYGHILDEVAISDPVNGRDMAITIDSELQKKLYEELGSMIQSRSTGRGGAAVAIDPRNGEILALVSWPNFNSNDFSEGISQAKYEELVEDQRQPLFNRPISGQYPPGSSFKPLLASAALQEKIIDPKKQIYDPGYLLVPNPYNPNGYTSFPDWQPQGWVDMEKAIAWSANVYFYIIGGGYSDIAGLGISKISEYCSLFGLGRQTGIDLPAESAGFVPDENSKEDLKSWDPIWRLGDTYHVSIGQGDLLVTPLQLASAISAIANGGTLYKPHLFKGVLDEDLNFTETKNSEIANANFIDKANLEIVRQGMKAVNTYGSGMSFKGMPFTSGGKTGTAQFGPNNAYTHSWYVSFAPYENPEIAMAVLVEGGGEGSASAVPVARRVLEWYFSDQTSTSSAE